MTATTTELPMVLAEVRVDAVERLSPSFVRVVLGGDALADFGVDGEPFDQRIKLVFPNADGELSSFAGADASWLSTWLDRPAEERGHMRTYTVRAVRGSGAATQLVVDFVVPWDHGAHGPGSAWAETAQPGDGVIILCPRRGYPFGGIEFAPGASSRLLLVGDETAVPAISAILDGLPADAAGAAYLEVPVAGDVLELAAPSGMRVEWIAREGAEHGAGLHAAVCAYLGEPAAQLAPVTDDEIDPDLWETPTYSSSGEELPEDGALPVAEERLAGLYAWIAGESSVVTGLRRHLVRNLGMDRRQVCFMGYWRRGVAMRS